MDGDYDVESEYSQARGFEGAAGGGAGDRAALFEWQDRPVVLAGGRQGSGVSAALQQCERGDGVNGFSAAA